MNWDKYLNEAGVPLELWDEAKACFEEAKNRNKIFESEVGKFAWKACFKMPWLMYCTKQVKWEDNFLPAKYWRYDNNVSMNGDQWGMILPDGTHTGEFSRERVDSGECIAIPYTDPNFKGDCYYAKGHHPRSKFARSIWLGFRNRASKFAQYLGEKADMNEPLVQYGPDQSRKVEGFNFKRKGKLWQFTRTKKVFFGLFVLVQNIGFKINNVSHEPGADMASYTYIPFSLKGRQK